VIGSEVPPWPSTAWGGPMTRSAVSLWDSAPVLLNNYPAGQRASPSVRSRNWHGPELVIGTRLFERNDGWEVRYQRVLGAWTLELKPPQGTYVDFSRVRVRTTESCWRKELPELITMLAPR
jgi:hypothetical protein